VNTLCDRALLSAFVRESTEVSFWDVRRALRDLANLAP
jgi:general secretion pathway protein A